MLNMDHIYAEDTIVDLFLKFNEEWYLENPNKFTNFFPSLYDPCEFITIGHTYFLWVIKCLSVLSNKCCLCFSQIWLFFSFAYSNMSVNVKFEVMFGFRWWNVYNMVRLGRMATGLIWETFFPHNNVVRMLHTGDWISNVVTTGFSIDVDTFNNIKI